MVHPSASGAEAGPQDGTRAVLTATELEEAADVAGRLARWAVARIRSRRREPGERRTKSGPADWVTGTDVDVERHVRAELATAFPGHAVVGEELGGEEPTGGRPCWYLDPVDGTTNFVHDLAGYTFSLALADADGLAVGVVGDPCSGELWEAGRGGGARIDGEPVAASGTATLAGEIVLMELAGHRLWPGQTRTMDELSRRHCVTRILGSSAASIVSVATGRAAGVLFGGSHPIDVAAGVLIAVEAGAVVAAGPATHPVLAGSRRVERNGLAVVAPGVADELLALWSAAAGER